MSAAMQPSMTLPHALDIERLVSPRSIAIIGASNDPKSISGQPMRFLMQHSYQGVLYPVNPKYADIAGLRATQALRACPQRPISR